jgi:hypothetical protein
VLAGHVILATKQGRLDRTWRRRFEGVVAIGLLPYAAMLRSLLASTRDRKGTFQPAFPLDASRELLGHQYVAVFVIGALAVYALSRPSLLHRYAPAAAVVAAGLVMIWVGVHPLDLYPRFLVWLIPAVALAVGSAVARQPKLALVVAIAVVAMLASQITTWNTDPIASRQLAHIVEASRAAGRRPCAEGYSSEILLGYTRPVRSVTTTSQLSGCDLVFIELGSSGSGSAALECRFRREETLAGLTKVVVFSQPYGSSVAASSC